MAILNHPGLRRAAGFAVWPLAALLLPLLAGAETDSTTEYRLKAAYLFNFAKFMEWPARAFPDPQSPIVFAVLGANPFGSILEQDLTGKKVGGRELRIKYFQTLEELEPCHLLFVSRSEDQSWPQIFSALKGPIATVGETEGFTRAGGVFRFFLEENKVRFEVNIDAAQRAELTISSKLLKVGVIIREGPPAK
jgi:hypothetical protein